MSDNVQWLFFTYWWKLNRMQLWFAVKKSKQKLATNFGKIQALCSNFKMHRAGSKQNTYMCVYMSDRHKPTHRAELSQSLANQSPIYHNVQKWDAGHSCRNVARPMHYTEDKDTARWQIIRRRRPTSLEQFAGCTASRRGLWTVQSATKDTFV